MEQKIAPPKIMVGGLTRLSTLDFPGYLAAIIFTQGCPWRCGYCHNRSLLDLDEKTAISWEQVMDFLSRRRGILEGVVFSGGEPTFWPHLSGYIREVRQLGFAVALHTNGAYPDRLLFLLEEHLVDWLALDLKAPFDDYQRINGIPGSGSQVRRAMQIALQSRIPCEFRTTIHPEILTIQDILTIARFVFEAGAKRYVLQKCRTEYSLDPLLRIRGYDFEDYLQRLRSELVKISPSIEIR
jgi:pyruvate formate lyase activating enzyme